MEEATVEEVNDVGALVFDIAVDGASDESSPDGDIESGDFVESNSVEQCRVEPGAAGADEGGFEFAFFESAGDAQCEQRRTTEGEFAVQQQHSQGLFSHACSLHDGSGISSNPAGVGESGEICGCAGSGGVEIIGYGGSRRRCVCAGSG